MRYLHGDNVRRLPVQLLQILLIMKSTTNKKTFRIAFCALIAALAVVLMIITTFVPFGTYALPIFAGALLIAVVIEYNCKWALGIYLVVSILSAFLVGDKEAVVFFIALFGYYPIVKNVFESKVKNKVIVLVLKLILFNIAAVAAFFFTSFVLSISPEEYTIFGFYVPYMFLILGNVIFLLYDKALSVLVVYYVKVLSPKLFRNRKM